MVSILANRMKGIICITLPIAIAIYLMYPLLAGYYIYPIAEYQIYKSFMINFIDSLKTGILPVWNEYVGCGQPAMYFGHYPISQNTVIYMLFGFSDFTYYLTKCFSLIILIFAFIYACKFLKLDYWTSLIGALVYFSINFVIKIFVAETIGNLLIVYPLLMIFIIKIVQEHKTKDILIFSLFYIFWLSGNHIIYAYMHLVMLSVFFWIATFVYYGQNALRLRKIIKFFILYVVLFIIPFLATLYQYYFVYDVIANSNRLKEGLIVSPFQPIAWKQLIVSMKSSAYCWSGFFLIIIYMVSKLLIKGFSFLKTKKYNIYAVGLLFLLIIVVFSFPEKSLRFFGLLGKNHNIVTLSKTGNYIVVDSAKNIIANGEFSTNAEGWKSNLVTLSNVSGGKSGNCLMITTSQDATGYAYYIVPTSIGHTYNFSVFYRKGTADNGQIKIGTSVDDNSLYYSGVLSNSDWVGYSGSFKAVTATTYVTLVDLTSVKGETSYFDGITFYELRPSIISDYLPILKSFVFRISLIIFLLMNLVFLYRNRVNFYITFPSILYLFCVFVIYVSLLAHYFFSPANIVGVGDINGYDFDLFRELSILYQIIFVFCVLYSMKEYQRNKVVRITVLSLIVLYLIRSHLTIVLLRFTGIVWYATRDGSIFSFFFAVLFMFGLKRMFHDFSQFFRNKETFLTIKYCFIYFLLLLLIGDSYHKFYKGTSHRFIYPNKKESAKTPMEKYVVFGREEATLLNKKLLDLTKNVNHFYRIFIPQNHYLYISGIAQRYKIHEATIYESSISRELKDFYDYTVMKKPIISADRLEYTMPYFLFTKHVHLGLNVPSTDIQYKDVFVFDPENDPKYLRNQNIEFLWDLMQVKYLIVGPAFSEVLKEFSGYDANYKLISHYSRLDLNLYEIVRKKNYSKLAVYPLEKEEEYNKIMEKINSKDINILKNIYSKLIFLDRADSDFELSKIFSDNNSRHYEIKATKPGILIDFESWNANWQLAINSKKRSLDKAFHIFKAIEINKGLNSITLVYSPRYFKVFFLYGIIITLIYVLFFAIVYHREMRFENRV